MKKEADVEMEARPLVSAAPQPSENNYEPNAPGVAYPHLPDHDSTPTVRGVVSAVQPLASAAAAVVAAPNPSGVVYSNPALPSAGSRRSYPV